MQAWRLEVATRPELPDPAGAAAGKALADAGAAPGGPVRSIRGYLLGPDLDEKEVGVFARHVLADPVVDELRIYGPDAESPGTETGSHRITVVLRPGVTDHVAHSVQKAMTDAGLPETPAAAYRAFLVPGPVDADRLFAAARRTLANDVIQEVLLDQLPEGLPGPGGEADLSLRTVELSDLDREGLEKVSREGGLALLAEEMAAIQAHFAELDRAPTRMELETIAQTWSEHCKHKTLTGKIRFEGEVIDNLLKTTIAHVTHELDRDFCVSVFVDNAGVVRFDDEDSVCIKVETHNHPSAIEPFGGAGTGVGGVIRDVLGTGLGARPVASTDVFCFAPVDMPAERVPPGCLHPLTLMRGVVAGVRDYGNPMGIPTVNGSIHFDPDFVGNPLVYVGNVGMLPTARAHKQPRAGDVVLAIGGRTGRDGIHGATFSSLELHTESETLSSGAVQIGDPITERKCMDAVLRAAEEDLFSAITDCGAGGFSSAVGEMAEGLGAEVELSQVPLKYHGLAPWEIWISEAQERMVLAVPPEKLDRVLEICREEHCEATPIGKFTDTGRLVVRYDGRMHADLDLQFLHEGLPVLERQARYDPPEVTDPELESESDLRGALLGCLSDPNVASKEWVIRQYDHEVQAGSAGKPLCGPREDGPADAAVLAPKLGSRRGIVLANGLNPRYSRIDPAAMAECALDEAMRNVVAAGGDPDYTAVLDNYCWGNTNKPERLGELVRASFALRDLALRYRTPFVSGKDSLNNEFRSGDRTIAVPGCILVTALSVIADVGRTLGSAFQAAGNRVVLVGVTRRELGGSVYWKLRGELGAGVPRVDADLGVKVLRGVARAIQAGCAASAHDLSEGGLGVALAEMCMGGRLGAHIDLAALRAEGDFRGPEELLFSESQSRILLEVPPGRMQDLAANLHEAPWCELGEVQDGPALTLARDGRELLRVDLEDMLHAWRHPLDLDGTMTEARS